MSDPLIVAEVVREMFEEADALKAEAEALPEWRPKRRRLLNRAKDIRTVAGQVWADHTNPQPVVVVVVRRPFFFQSATCGLDNRKE